MEDKYLFSKSVVAELDSGMGIEWKQWWKNHFYYWLLLYHFSGGNPSSKMYFEYFKLLNAKINGWSRQLQQQKKVNLVFNKISIQFDHILKPFYKGKI